MLADEYPSYSELLFLLPVFDYAVVHLVKTHVGHEAASFAFSTGCNPYLAVEELCWVRFH